MTETARASETTARETERNRRGARRRSRNCRRTSVGCARSHRARSARSPAAVEARRSAAAQHEPESAVGLAVLEQFVAGLAAGRLKVAGARGIGGGYADRLARGRVGVSF